MRTCVAGPPPLESLAAEWQAYAQGFGPDKDGFGPPTHGLALPTANSLRGSVIADENVLAVRSLTLPPLTQGPYSTAVRNVSRLGRLTVDGRPVLTEFTKWMPGGFARRASGGWGKAESTVWLPLDEDALIMHVELSSSARGGAGPAAEEVQLDVQFLTEVRKWPRPLCTERDRRYPTGMVKHCWNWFAPRTTEAQRADFRVGALHEYHEAAGVWMGYDSRSDARVAIALAGSRRATVRNGGSGEGLHWHLKLRRGASAALRAALVFGDASDGGREAQAALAARAAFLARDVGSSVAAWSAERQARWAQVFTPANARYSGHLPSLHTADAALCRTYYHGALALLDHERVGPFYAPTPRAARERARRAFEAQHGGTAPSRRLAQQARGRSGGRGGGAAGGRRRRDRRVQRNAHARQRGEGGGGGGGETLAAAGGRRVWITGAGENASTNSFFWDQGYHPLALALLEPRGLRADLLLYLRPAVGGDDALAGWGVDWPSGEAVGSWYAANDVTLAKLAHAYLTTTRDVSLLDEPLLPAGAPSAAAGAAGGAAGGAAAAPTVRSQLSRLALAWRARTSPAGSGGLADFGGPPNLLECVPTYVHRVAAFNAAAVWTTRAVAAPLREAEAAATPPAPTAAQLRRAADELAAAVLGLAVGDGSGVWYAEQPDGRRLLNRHVIDFAYVAEFMSADLPPRLRGQMVRFVRRELLQPEQGWMRAQSLDDPAAKDSDRTDHGPWGAYAGWPAITASSLAALGHQREGLEVLRRAAALTTRGPWGQAHALHRSAAPGARAARGDHSGAAYKPFAFTLYNEAVGAAFVDATLHVLFGLRAAAAPLLRSTPTPPHEPAQSGGIAASLHGLLWQGSLFNATSAASGGVTWHRAS